MENWIVKETQMFHKKFNKLIPKHSQEQVRQRIMKLAEQPYQGKPLGYDFLREIKIGKYRIYYVLFKEQITLLLITISDKKTQQDTINMIKKNIGEYKRYL